MWGSSRRNASSGPNQSHQYDYSRDGNFAMRTFGSSTKPKYGGKRGLNDITNLDHDSEEHIVEPSKETQIVMSTEVKVETSDQHATHNYGNDTHVPDKDANRHGRQGKRMSMW
jgi:hypothetical protein